MHELSLAEDMLDLIQTRAKSDNFERVLKVTLEIGRLSHVEADAMAFCFDAVVKSTIAEGAELQIVTTEGIGKCRQCQQQTPLEQLYDPCLHCGAFGVDLVQGDGVNIKSLKVV